MKKTLPFLLVFLSFSAFYLLLPSSCTKAKVPPSFGDTTCADTISFAQKIAPMIQDNCASCHGYGGGNSPSLSNYAEISSNADAILNALKGIPQLMPQGGPALPDSLIQQFSCWIIQGKKEN